MAMVIAFVVNAPGFYHAGSASHNYEQSINDAPAGERAGKTSIDCHFGLTHIHLLDRTRVAALLERVVWTSERFQTRNLPLPKGTDLSPPYKPPRI